MFSSNSFYPIHIIGIVVDNNDNNNNNYWIKMT